MPATMAGVSETMSVRSRFKPLLEPLPVPIRLMSQKTPLARKPLGATMEPEISLNDFNLIFIEPRKTQNDTKNKMAAACWWGERPREPLESAPSGSSEASPHQRVVRVVRVFRG